MRFPPEDTDIVLDMNGREVVILYALAGLGAAVMAGNARSIINIREMLGKQEDGEDVAERAMAKMYAALSVLKATIPDTLQREPYDA